MFDATRRILLFFVGFTVPMDTLGAFSFGGYPVGPSKLATGLLLLLALTTWALTGRAVPWNRKHPWVIAFALGVLLGTATSLVTGGISLRAVGILWSSYAAVIIFSFLLPYTIRKQRDLHLLLGGLVFGCIASIVAGLARGGGGFAAERFQGTEGNPNNLAANMVLTLPIMFAFLFSSRALVRKAFFLGASILAVGGVVASVSRAGLVSLVGMWGLWAAYFRRLDTLRYIVPTVLLAVGVVLFAPQSFKERMGTMAPEEVEDEGSAQKRLIMGYWAIRAMIEHPVLGVGLRKTGEFASQRDPRIGPGHAVHNAYLQVGANFGLFGFVPLLTFTILTWMDFSLVRRVARRRDLRQDATLRLFAYWATFLQISFFGTLVFAQFHPTSRDKALWLLVGLSSALVAMAKNRLRELRSSTAPAPSQPGPLRGGFDWQPQAVGEGRS